MSVRNKHVAHIYTLSGKAKQECPDPKNVSKPKKFAGARRTTCARARLNRSKFCRRTIRVPYSNTPRSRPAPPCVFEQYYYVLKYYCIIINHRPSLSVSASVSVRKKFFARAAWYIVRTCCCCLLTLCQKVRMCYTIKSRVVTFHNNFSLAGSSSQSS